jgi:hypothetical protein
LRQREDEVAALLAELVAIPTENPPEKKLSRLRGSSGEPLAANSILMLGGESGGRKSIAIQR